MPYPEHFIGPMRAELVRFGVEETRTPEAVEQVVQPGSGTVLMIINSMCGCAASKARPAIGKALEHKNRPDKVATVFAGGDEDATDRVRELLSNYPPSSPSMALFVDGKPVEMIHRRDIEMRGPDQIAHLLTQMFDMYCVKN